MHKRVIAALAGVALMSSFSLAESQVNVLVDGQQLTFEDQNPVIESGRTLVPLRGIFEALGAKVEWDGPNKTVVANKRTKYIILEIDNDRMNVNGEEKALDVPAKIMNDRTMIPLRAVAEALDTEVKWNPDTYTVTVNSQLGEVKYTDKTISVTVKDEVSGQPLLDIKYNYPEFEPRTGVFISLNKENQEKANQYVSTIKLEQLEGAKEYYEMLKEYIEKEGDLPLPLEFKVDFEVTYNKDNKLSIMSEDMEYTGGAHPMTYRESNTYDITTGKELELTDIYPDKTKDKINDMIIAKFEEDLAAGKELTLDGTVNPIRENIESVKFYLTDEGVLCYFGQYEVGPYALGFPSVTLDY